MKFYGSDHSNVMQRRLRPAYIDDPQIGGFLEALPDGAALLEVDGTIKLVNHKLELLLNLAKGELVGSDLGKHARTVGPVIQKLAAALQQLKRVETAGVLNSQRNVVASLSILRSPDGGAYGALMTMRESARQVRTTSLDGFRFESEFAEREGSAYIRTPLLDGLSKRAKNALDRGSAVMLTGESGTGKTEFARHMAHTDAAATVPFVEVNCGTLSDSHFDIEMFGIEPASPLDTSTRGKLGYVEAADGGILFLDQVTDLSPAAQMKLVALLETQTFSRIGSTQRRRVRIRLITSTNEDLQSLVADGRFRRDLYYRICVVNITLPSLHDQPDLIEAVAYRQMQRINHGRKPTLKLSPEFSERLMRHDYPGNVREMINILEYAAAAADQIATAEHFCAPALPSSGSSVPEAVAASTDPVNVTSRPLREIMQEFESWVLEKSIAENGSKRSAAKALGVDVATLVRKTRRKT